MLIHCTFFLALYWPAKLEDIMFLMLCGFGGPPVLPGNVECLQGCTLQYSGAGA